MAECNRETLELVAENQRRHVSYEDTHGVARVLVIYSGGTIGMVNDGDGYVPRPNCMVEKLKSMPIFHCKDRTDLLGPDEEDFLILHVGQIGVHDIRPTIKDRNYVVYNVIEFEPLLDSSNMVINDWIKMGQAIENNYSKYDGFVLLHGTDTMAYSAAALSFMCEDLGKPIILTGAQIPIFETRSDGRDNFLASLIIAGNYAIPEVMLCFNDKAFRGNRCIKSDSDSFSAFSSPNMAPIVTLEIEIKVDWASIFRANTTEKFKLHTSMCPNVGMLRLFPGITTQTVRAFLQPPVQGVVLQTYGSGNAPNNRPDILALIKDACNWGVLIVNITQCSRGNVAAAYATGMALKDIGVISGGDMTPESALTKLCYVLGKDTWSTEKKKQVLARNLRGEMTMVNNEKMDIKEIDLIESVARYMSLSSKEEMVKLKEAIYPSMMCAAASNNDIPSLEKLRMSGGNLGLGNQDQRTPLHVVSRQGHLNVVQYLLHHGVSVHHKDYRGETALIDAVEGGHVDVVQLLVTTGANIPLPSSVVAVRMCSAAAKDDVTCLKCWLAAGAKVDWSDYDDRTPLHVAVTLQQENAAVFLIQEGASPNMTDTFGNTPRSIATSLGLESILKLMNKKGEAGSNHSGD